jgi:hypothetical protein
MMAPAGHDEKDRAAVAFLSLALLLILLVPHLSRIRHASLYGDDVQRIADLQARPLSALWFRPFNEHMAPFFETVTWATWQAAGRELTGAPLAFTLASYVPFVLCLVWLERLVRIESGSRATALAATVLFGLSPLSAETVFWYSASSFTWALFWTLVVLRCAASTGETPGRVRRSGLLLGALLAPACSGIGILAGPLGSLRLAGDRRDSRPGRLAVALPAIGSLLYLAICSAFRYRSIIHSGLRRNSEIAAGLLHALLAPTARLLPGTFGFYDADAWLSPRLDLVLTVLGLTAILGWGIRSRHRGLIATALGLVLGGYALTYPFRNQDGAYWLFRTERYHLFPQLGLVLLIALGARRWLGRFDRSRLEALVAATVLAVFLLAIHGGRFETVARRYHFPEQRRTLAALERLGTLCRERNVARQECVAALDPVWSYWFQPEFNGLSMLPAPTEVSGWPDPQLRQTLLAQLTPADCKALWGGMDVSPYLRPLEDLAGDLPDCVAVGRLVETDHSRCTQRPLGKGMREYIRTGRPAYLEFELTPPESSKRDGPGAPRFLCLPCGPSSRPVEIWWTSGSEPWSPSRSVRLGTRPRPSPREWVIPLDRVPQWDPNDASRIRIGINAGPIALGAPRLLR